MSDNENDRAFDYGVAYDDLTPAEKARRTRHENESVTPAGVTIDSTPAAAEPQTEGASAVGGADADEKTVQLRIAGMPYQTSFLFADADGTEYEVTNAVEGVPIPVRLAGTVIRAAARSALGVVPVVFEAEPGE